MSDDGDSFFLPLRASAVAVRLVLIALSGVLALSIPNFGFIVGLMGAFTTMLISFVLPAAFYLIVRGRSLSPLAIAGCVAVVAIGFAGMGVGLQATLAKAA